MSDQSYFEKFIRLVKLFRPEFYNKLTWTIVVAGISIMSTTLVDRLVDYFMEVSFHIKVTDGNDSLFGFLLVVAGLSYHFVSRNVELREKAVFDKEKKLKNNNHDASVFERLAQTMEEQSLKEILDWVGMDHAYESNEIRKIDNFCREARKRENSYLDAEIENKKNDLIAVLERLYGFLCSHFFNFPNNQVTRLCLYPDLNIDRGLDFPDTQKQQRYDQRAGEMLNLIDSAYEAYADYRTTVKKQLFI